MRKHLLFVLAFVVAWSAITIAQEPSAHEPATWKELVAGRSKLQFYGFIRLDVIFDDSHPNSFQSPLYIFSEDQTLVASTQNNFTMHPRLTRFGFNLKGPQAAWANDAELSGNLELDFQNGGSESRQIIRIRHAYLKLGWTRLALVAGQTWDVIAPLLPTANNDALMWNTGNIGDRRPQIRLAWKQKAGQGAFTFAGAAGLTGAVDSQDLDGNGVRDGEASGLPHIQARVDYTGSIGENQWSTGLSGLYGWQKTATPFVADKNTFQPRAVAFDLRLPVQKWLTIQAEAWHGKNLADFRGGIAQGVNNDRNSPSFGEEIESRGGWVELGLKAGKTWGLYPGYALDDPRDENVPDGTSQATAGRTKNQAWYLTTRWQPDHSFLVGLDLLHWTTEYKAFANGDDNRLDLYLQYNF